MRYFSCGIIVLGMMFCVSAYADDAPGQELEPEVTQQVEQTPEPDVEPTLESVPVTEPPVATPEPFITAEPEASPKITPEVSSEPSLEASPDATITPGNENGSLEDLISPDNSTASNQQEPDQSSYAPPPVGEMDFIELTPEVEPTPEAESYEVQVLTVMGSIQAYLIFLVIVILCFFSYKFFRIFF